MKLFEFQQTHPRHPRSEESERNKDPAIAFSYFFLAVLSDSLSSYSSSKRLSQSAPINLSSNEESITNL